MATLTVEVNASSLDAKDTREDASLINALIPALFKRRAGRLPSIRRFFAARLPDQAYGSPPPSPPPPYAEPHSIETDEMSEAQDFAACLDDLMARGPKNALYVVAGKKSASGIRWKHVDEGCRLVRSAGREAAGDEEDPQLTRKMFIDGVGYLLKALPDLSPDEKSQLSTYLPNSLRSTDDQQPHECTQLACDGEVFDQNNWIYQLVTLATMYGVLLVSVVLPILERFAATLYRYDQRYSISARLAESTTQTISSMGKKVVQSLDEGRTGQVALGLTFYVITNASKGVANGYERAVRRQGAIEGQSQKSKQCLPAKD